MEKQSLAEWHAQGGVAGGREVPVPARRPSLVSLLLRGEPGYINASGVSCDTLGEVVTGGRVAELGLGMAQEMARPTCKAGQQWDTIGWGVEQDLVTCKHRGKRSPFADLGPPDQLR